jgi:DNA-binding NarL/FixJ family response regulator
MSLDVNEEQRAHALSIFQTYSSEFRSIAEKRARRSNSSSRAPEVVPEREAGELTSREVDVLGLIANGCSNSEIGRHLFIAEETVKTHVRRVLEKLAAKNRAHAVAVAFRRGLLVAIAPHVATR